MEKENKKSNNTGVIILLAILLIAVLAFGIWAWSKYTSTLEGNGTATVAKWNFGTTTELTNLDLATTSGATKFDTVQNVATDRIAPGTKGSFTVALNTTGTEVALKYLIELSNIANKPTNLHFYSDEACTQQIDASAGTSASYSGYIAQGDTGTTHNVTIYWEWKYETGTTADEIAANDQIDTTEGTAAKQVTFDLKITGTQVDPGTTQVTTTTTTTT